MNSSSLLLQKKQEERPSLKDYGEALSVLYGRSMARLVWDYNWEEHQCCQSFYPVSKSAVCSMKRKLITCGVRGLLRSGRIGMFVVLGLLLATDGCSSQPPHPLAILERRPLVSVEINFSQSSGFIAG